MKLEGKVAVITGATSGLGLATAKRFVEQGAFVYITGRRQLELDKAVKIIGKSVVGVRGDVSNESDMIHLANIIKEEKGKIDIIYANAGTWDFNVALEDITEEKIHRTLSVNVKGTIFTVQKISPLLSDGGVILMTGSISYIKGFPGMALYNASKAALPALARTWMQELKSRKIRVNVLTPGPIDNPDHEILQEVKDQFSALVPLGRLGKPDEIASAALFLASSDSSFVNGIELCVDGGAAQV